MKRVLIQITVILDQCIVCSRAPRNYEALQATTFPHGLDALSLVTVQRKA